MLLKLKDFTQDAHPNGNVKGKAVYASLLQFVESHQEKNTFGISLQGIIATDASFQERVLCHWQNIILERSFSI